MRLHRFYLKEDIGNQNEFRVNDPELLHQIVNVFRLKKGDSVIFFSGTGFDYECKIDEISSGSKIKRAKDAHGALFHLATSRRSAFSPARKIFLCASVVKKDNFEWIVQKATELGVTDIMPVITEHSEKKSLNMDRLKKISIEASEQSGRGDVPVIHEIANLAEALKVVGGATSETKVVVFHTEGTKLNKDDFEDKEMPLAVFIGPEGGWSESELDMFHKNNIDIVSLGGQVLRAETAVIAALSQFVFR